MEVLAISEFYADQWMHGPRTISATEIRTPTCIHLPSWWSAK